MIWLVTSLLVVLLLVGAAIAAHLLFWSRNEVPFVSTPKSVIEQIIYALHISDNGTIFELGCGDGRVLKAIHNPTKSKLIGVDNNPMVLMVAHLRVRKNAKLVRGDILKTDLSEATRVFCYLSDKLMAELEPRFERQLGSGSKVVSLQFRLPSRKPSRVIRLKDGRAWAQNLYVYDY